MKKSLQFSNSCQNFDKQTQVPKQNQYYPIIQDTVFQNPNYNYLKKKLFSPKMQISKSQDKKNASADIILENSDKQNKFWRTKNKYEEAQKHINKLGDKKSTFQNFSFTQIERSENPALEHLLFNLTDQKQQGSLNLVDMWPRSVKKKYLQLTEQEEARRLIKGISHGQSGLKLVKCQKKEPDIFGSKEEIRVIATQNKKSESKFHGMSAACLPKKVEYKKQLDQEIKQEFYQIGIKNYCEKQEEQFQYIFVQFLNNLLQDCQQGQNYLNLESYQRFFDSREGRRFLIHIYQKTQDHNTLKKQGLFNKYLQFFDNTQKNQKQNNFNSQNNSIEQEQQQQQQNKTFYSQQQKKNQQSFSDILQHLIQMQDINYQQKIAQTIQKNINKFENKISDPTNQNIINSNMNKSNMIYSLNVSYVNPNQQINEQNQIQDKSVIEQSNKNKQITDNHKNSSKLKNMLEKLDILEKQNIVEFENLDNISSKLELTIFQNAKKTSWMPVYRQRNIKPQHQSVIDKLEQRYGNQLKDKHLYRNDD